MNSLHNGRQILKSSLPLFGTAYAAPNNGITIYTNLLILISSMSQSAVFFFFFFFFFFCFFLGGGGCFQGLKFGPIPNGI